MEPQLDHLGVLALPGVILISVLPPFVSIIAVMTDLDPFYYVLYEFLSHPYYRSVKVILVEPLARMIAVYFLLSEILRTAYITLVVIIATIYMFISIESSLQRVRVVGTNCLTAYVRARLVLATLGSEFIGNLIFVGLTLLHLALVFLVWVFIKIINNFPVFLIVMFGLVLLFLTGIMVLVLPVVARVSHESVILIKKKLDFYYCSSMRVKGRFYFMARWRAQQPLELKCGTFFSVKKGITRHFVNNLITNIANAVILISP